MLSTHRHDEWDRFLDTHDATDNSIYKLNENLFYKTTTTHSIFCPNGLIFSAIKKAKIFADIFESQFTPNPGHILPEVNANLNTILETAISNSFFTIPCLTKKIIKHLPSRKTLGKIPSPMPFSKICLERLYLYYHTF